MQNVMYLMLFGPGNMYQLPHPTATELHELPGSESWCKTVNPGARVDEGMENVRQESYRGGPFGIVVWKCYGEFQHRTLVES